MNFDKQPKNDPYGDRDLGQLLPLLSENENMTFIARKQLLKRIGLIFDKSPVKQKEKAIEFIFPAIFSQFKNLEDTEAILDNVVEGDMRHQSGKSALPQDFIVMYELFESRMITLREVLEQKKTLSFENIDSYRKDLVARMHVLTEIAQKLLVLKDSMNF